MIDISLVVAIADRDLQTRLDTLTHSRTCLLCVVQSGDRDREVVRFDVDEGITCDDSIQGIFSYRGYRNYTKRKGVLTHGPAEILSHIGYQAENEFGKVAL